MSTSNLTSQGFFNQVNSSEVPIDSDHDNEAIPQWQRFLGNCAVATLGLFFVVGIFALISWLVQQDLKNHHDSSKPQPHGF